MLLVYRHRRQNVGMPRVAVERRRVEKISQYDPPGYRVNNHVTLRYDSPEHCVLFAHLVMQSASDVAADVKY